MCKIELKIVLLILFIAFVAKDCYAQTSTLVAVDNNTKLVYTADSKGNTIPDFSGVGYKNSETSIPSIAVVKTVNAISGDNLTNVQNAINEVAAMPLNANGFRGAILFKKGTYNISDTINIVASGIVLRGEGTDASGTVFTATKTSQYTLFNFEGKNSTTVDYTSRKAITDAYVPVGTKQVTVAAGHTFKVNDNVFLHKIPNQAWIDLLTMAQWGWIPSGYDVYFERKVIAVNGNSITLDAPVVDMIDPTYATAELIKFTSARIQNCGIEDMRITSTYASATDENHGWTAVAFNNIINSWAQNLEVYYFGYSAVHVRVGASFITVDSCKMLDAKSTVDGGRRYSFNVDGQRTLVQNCYTRNGRHDYVNGSQTAGPNVFYNCTATSQLNDIGPHHRWSTGILFDNITGNGKMDVQNRTSSGTGHGWAGAQTMFWNCNAASMVIQDPQGDARNWAIGCVATISNVGDMTTEPLGIIESSGKRITAIASLFKAQLNDRLNTSLPVQITAISANLKANGVAINWQVLNEVSIDNYTIESSNKTFGFTACGTVNANASNTYSYYDATPFVGTKYYRLKIIDLNGSVAYSRVVAIQSTNTQVEIYPNPVKNYLNIVGIKGKSNIHIANANGQLVLQRKVNGNAITLNVSNVQSGFNTINIITEDKTIITKYFIKQ